jgi:hypothetical protein
MRWAYFYDSTTLSITMISIMTLSIIEININDILATLSINNSA